MGLFGTDAHINQTMDRTCVELAGKSQDSLPGLNKMTPRSPLRRERTQTVPVTSKAWPKKPIARGD